MAKDDIFTPCKEDAEVEGAPSNVLPYTPASRPPLTDEEKEEERKAEGFVLSSKLIGWLIIIIIAYLIYKNIKKRG